MKTRVISAIFILAIAVPLLLKGGIAFALLVYLLSLIGLYELIKAKETKKKLPDFIKFISFILLTMFMLINKNNIDGFSISYQLISALFLSYFVPILFYHDRAKYSINDAFYMTGAIFFLGVSFSMFIIVRSININILIYAFIISIITDTYAYITGLLIGSHKLIETISPKKTIEGLVGGTFFGVMCAATYYCLVINVSNPIYIIILITIFLSLLGQLGDLFFSAIKRQYNVKDFSNLIPGHGGILDRLDSIIFILLGIMFLINIL